MKARVRTTKRAGAAGGRLIAAALVAVGLAVTEPADAEVLGRYLSGIDVSAFRECSWQEGRPAQNHQIEQEIRTAVEAELKRLGYAVVTGDGADCWLRSHAIRDQAFPVGMLLIEIYKAPEAQIAFRGEATGLVNRTPKQITRDVRKSVKKMFKYYPRAAPAEVD